MTDAEALEYARAWGRAGKGWMDLTADDTLGDYCTEHIDTFDTNAIQRAFDEGRLAWKADGGWLIRWTTAPDGYDGFQTESIEACGDYKGRPLRRVLIDPRYLTWHEDRYGSGLHPTWSADPREVDRLFAERADRIRLHREQDKARRAAGLEWLLALDDASLELAIESDDLEGHGIDYKDARAESKRRTACRETAAREAEWQRCRALLPDGVILVDDGAPSTSGRYGRIPGRDAHVYYDVRVDTWNQYTDEAKVWTHASRELVGSLAYVVSWLEQGRLRIVSAADVPPARVVQRVGYARWKEIRRVTVGDRVAWFTREPFGHELLVLDESGRKVRAKAIRDAAMAAWLGP